MKWVYLTAILIVFIRLGVITHGTVEAPADIVESLAREAGVPNTVSGILLRNRLFDTVFEVFVFTIAGLGARFLLSRQQPEPRVRYIADEVSGALARLGAAIAAMVCVEMALRGHLSPGGGFAAGVAGGTAIGLLAVTSAPGEMESHYRRLKAAFWEKLAVLLFLAAAVATLAGIELPPGRFGSLLSGGTIPLLNVLIAVKVTLGAWGIVLAFIRYRGLL